MGVLQGGTCHLQGLKKSFCLRIIEPLRLQDIGFPGKRDSVCKWEKWIKHGFLWNYFLRTGEAVCLAGNWAAETTLWVLWEPSTITSRISESSEWVEQLLYPVHKQPLSEWGEGQPGPDWTALLWLALLKMRQVLQPWHKVKKHLMCFLKQAGSSAKTRAFSRRTTPGKQEILEMRLLLEKGNLSTNSAGMLDNIENEN